jgi:hypothetical protein
MTTATIGPEIGKSALIIVDKQNDFLHPDGSFAQNTREVPEARIDMPFLVGTIPQVKRLASAFREAGGRSSTSRMFLNPIIPMRSSPIGVSGFLPAATGRIVWRGPGEPK